MIQRFLLEEELRRSGVVIDQAQVADIADLVMDMVKNGLLDRNSRSEPAISSGQQASPSLAGQPEYCRPSYHGDASRRMFLIKFEDAEVRDQLFEEEVSARAFFETAIENWNCYLFGLMER